ncbi:unnamed protein product, partial [Mesorhabditis spiculigera]
MDSTLLLCLTLLQLFYAHETVLLVPLTSTTTISSELIENCTSTCLESQPEFCVGFFIENDICELITNRSDTTLNFYIYDRNDDSKLSCPGESIAEEIATDGTWSEWGAYSDCSMTCGMYGTQMRNRCCPPEPETRGYYCVGDAVDVVACPTALCMGPTQLPCYSPYYQKGILAGTRGFSCIASPNTTDPRLED